MPPIELGPARPVSAVDVRLARTAGGTKDAPARAESTAAPVVGLSPIVAGTHVRGMAAQMLAAIGVETSSAAVAEHYGCRRDGGVLDAWLVDSRDGDEVARVEAAGIACRAVPLMMTDPDATAAMVGVDACPMEGFEPAKFDEILGLKPRGVQSLALAAAGYRAADDKYATLPKVRFPVDEVVVRV